MPTDNPLALDRQLCFALYSGEKAVSAAYRELLGPLGLTYPQYLVMLALWEEDGQPVSGLGRRLGLDSGTLSPLLKRLESAGHLRRDRDAADERVVRARLTAAGAALRRDALPVPGELFARMGLDPAEAAELGRLLGKICSTGRAAAAQAPRGKDAP
ncbi:MarR family winged helix-turn-helix transcriptional regulator [Arthrobacter halodurans]|uniref:MarR family winged helix-turn-helix transcriptional regulator n=1 Tax=Arthrobacter halodurans TaxID=516699 RepID=A0ABV4UNE0_9MICC